MFLGLFLWGVGSISAVLLRKYMKGNIKIRLSTRNFYYGEMIQGTFTLFAKKQITGHELVVHLIWYKKETSYSKWKKNTRNVEFFRVTQSIESGVVYESWLRRDYDFQLDIPSVGEVFGDQSVPDLWKSVFGKLARYSLKHMTNSNYTWQVRVDLEAEWLDLSGKRDIFVTKKDV